MEKILKIEEVSNVQHTPEGGWKSHYDGYKVVTDAQEIFILVSNGQSCCESYGYVVSEDDVQSFVGTDLTDVKVVDTGVNEKMVEAGQSLDCGDIMFVNLETNKGTLQFAVYNAHNGYYGHHGVVESVQIKKEVDL